MSLYFRLSTIERDLTCFLIRKVTWAEFSHVDICLPEGLLGAHTDGIKVNPFDYEPQARFAYFRADVLTPAQEQAAIAFWRSQVGKHYDFADIFGILAHIDIQESHGYICSVLAYAGLSQAAPGKPFLNESHLDRITPGMFMLSPYLVPCDPPAFAQGAKVA